VEHSGEFVHRPWAGLHPDAFARLAGVVELELVLLGDGLLGEGDLSTAAGRKRGGLSIGCGGVVVAALEEVERHGQAPWEDGIRWREW
jgi:hypothetical protein